jgi:hypothetical protein
MIFFELGFVEKLDEVDDCMLRKINLVSCSYLDIILTS